VRVGGDRRNYLADRGEVRPAPIGQDIEPKLASISDCVAELKRSSQPDRSLVSSIGSETAKLQRYVANLLDLDPASDQRPIEVGSVKIDTFHRAVWREGKEVHLTPKEYAVLAELSKYPGRVLTHVHLLKTVWGPAQEAQTEYLRVAVRALRQKLEANPAKPQIIINEPAVGYRLAAVQPDEALARAASKTTGLAN